MACGMLYQLILMQNFLLHIRGLRTAFSYTHGVSNLKQFLQRKKMKESYHGHLLTVDTQRSNKIELLL